MGNDWWIIALVVLVAPTITRLTRRLPKWLRVSIGLVSCFVFVGVFVWAAM